MEKIRQAIGKLREQKGKEKETLKLINEALSFGHDFIVNLFLEEALTHQHLYMNDSTNKKALADMEKAILKANSYVNKYKLNKWNSRLYRFMGRVADYRGQYKKAISLYKKSIKFVNLDPEPFRIFELKSFLSFSLIMSGKYLEGDKLAGQVYKIFVSSEGKLLKDKDYKTWFIWLSGHVMRILNAYLDKKVNYDKTRANEQLEFLEKEFSLKKFEFGYRKQEFEELKNRLKLN